MDLTELEATAKRELAKHGLNDWTFGLAETKRRLGACNYRTKHIEIARYFATNAPNELVIDTLLHEIAHALAGPKANHGPVWKNIAIQLGATPKACGHTPESAQQPGDWQTTCPACQKTHNFYIKPKNLTGYRCKCPARSPLVVEFRGDPKIQTNVPTVAPKSANWEARCAGCQAVHYRSRAPKPGVWRCRCPQRCEITWQPRAS